MDQATSNFTITHTSATIERNTDIIGKFLSDFQMKVNKQKIFGKGVTVVVEPINLNSEKKKVQPIFLIGGVIGFLFSVVLVIVKEFFRLKIYTSNSVIDSGIPLYGKIKTL
jgi:hypothetical protein